MDGTCLRLHLIFDVSLIRDDPSADEGFKCWLIKRMKSKGRCFLEIARQ